jgi:Bacterial regulatory helix-turn-helix protein, lysR family
MFKRPSIMNYREFLREIKRAWNAGCILQRFDLKDVNPPPPIVDQAGFLELQATSVTLLRCTPNICDKKSCVRCKVSLLSRSRLCSNHRLRRASNAWSALHLRHMRAWHYVEEVARAGSMRKAADRLNLTASVVQRRIRDVEQDLGMALFERTARGVRLLRLANCSLAGSTRNRRISIGAIANRRSCRAEEGQHPDRLQPGCGALVSAARDCTIPHDTSVCHFRR